MTEQEALKWIAELFEEPVENIRPETKQDEVEGWDSLGVLSLMAGLDEEFDILMSEEEMQNLHTVADILDVLKKNGCLS
jgi:acyl carrier protein